MNWDNIRKRKKTSDKFRRVSNEEFQKVISSRKATLSDDVDQDYLKMIRTSIKDMERIRFQKLLSRKARFILAVLKWSVLIYLIVSFMIGGFYILNPYSIDRNLKPVTSTTQSASLAETTTDIQEISTANEETPDAHEESADAETYLEETSISDPSFETTKKIYQQTSGSFELTQREKAVGYMVPRVGVYHRIAQDAEYDLIIYFDGLYKAATLYDTTNDINYVDNYPLLNIEKNSKFAFYIKDPTLSTSTPCQISQKGTTISLSSVTSKFIGDYVFKENIDPYDSKLNSFKKLLTNRKTQQGLFGNYILRGDTQTYHMKLYQDSDTITIKWYSYTGEYNRSPDDVPTIAADSKKFIITSSDENKIEAKSTSDDGNEYTLTISYAVDKTGREWVQVKEDAPRYPKNDYVNVSGKYFKYE